MIRSSVSINHHMLAPTCGCDSKLLTLSKQCPQGRQGEHNYEPLENNVLIDRKIIRDYIPIKFCTSQMFGLEKSESGRPMKRPRVEGWMEKARLAKPVPGVSCHTCHGSSFRPNSDVKDELCGTCRGKGVTFGDSSLKEELSVGGANRKVRVVKTDDGMGVGAYAGQGMSVGDVVGEYVGEVITKRTASARELVYAKAGLFYTMGIMMTNFVVDATHQVS